MSDFLTRLQTFLAFRGRGRVIRQLTPDASTREYFRVSWAGATAIACVYPEAFTRVEQSYLDVTDLFLRCGLPVAKVLDFDEQLGVIVMEDLGDVILRDRMAEVTPSEAEQLLDSAIDLIPRIQAATKEAYASDSIASRLRFDIEKLSWELGFFKDHYFDTLMKRPLDPAESGRLDREFTELSRELDKRATVLCHRDFHAANLMVDGAGRLRIIDHQDARIGSVAYDLVSLLLDRVTAAPSPDWLAEKRGRFLGSRVAAGLSALDEEEFAEEFRLQTIQRCLKAIGTFSYQSAMRGKTYFLPFIRPMFEIVNRAAGHVGRFAAIEEMTKRELNG